MKNDQIKVYTLNTIECICIRRGVQGIISIKTVFIKKKINIISHKMGSYRKKMINHNLPVFEKIDLIKVGVNEKLCHGKICVNCGLI